MVMKERETWGGSKATETRVSATIAGTKERAQTAAVTATRAAAEKGVQPSNGRQQAKKLQPVQKRNAPHLKESVRQALQARRKQGVNKTAAEVECSASCKKKSNAAFKRNGG